MGAEHKTLINCTRVLGQAKEHQAKVVQAAADHVAACEAEKADSAARLEVAASGFAAKDVKRITDAFDKRRVERAEIAQQIRDLQALL